MLNSERNRNFVFRPLQISTTRFLHDNPNPFVPTRRAHIAASKLFRGVVSSRFSKLNLRRAIVIKLKRVDGRLICHNSRKCLRIVKPFAMLRINLPPLKNFERSFFRQIATNLRNVK